MVDFIDCASINVTYNVMGIATINYTIINNEGSSAHTGNSITIGGKVFNGAITNLAKHPIPRSNYDDRGPFYEINVTMIAVN